MVIRRDDSDAFDIVYDRLVKGGVVILECDTIYGITGLNPASEERIRRIKNREHGKPFISLIGDSSWLPEFTDMKMPSSLERYWPGPLTLIFPVRDGGSIALRAPENEFIKELLKKLNKPLISTSVNREGDPPLSRISEIIRTFQGSVDLIVDSGDLTDHKPSTILDLTGSTFRILREGAVLVDLQSLTG